MTEYFRESIQGFPVERSFLHNMSESHFRQLWVEKNDVGGLVMKKFFESKNGCDTSVHFYVLHLVWY